MNNNEIEKILKDILKWQKWQGIQILRETIKEKNLFSNEKEALVYLYSDGNKSSREIEKITNVNYKKVQNLWKKWVEEGIAEQTEKYSGGRCRRLFEIDELGLNVPQDKNRIKR